MGDMSGNSRRRMSKWDHKDSEALPESFNERAPARKTRESPIRASRRHESRNKETIVPWDREGNGARISQEPDDWGDRRRSRSPRNDWGHLYRNRSRSRSPAQNSRREPAGNDRSRNKSGISGEICRDFAAGRCMRGSHCEFLHQDAELHGSGRPLKGSPPDEWDGRNRRMGGSRYSADEYAGRSERSVQLCNDFLKGRCRRGSSCIYAHHDASGDVIEKRPVDDDYRGRENDHRSRDTYQDRNRDREPSKKGETPLCKFFAAGNCRNGKRCRFSHQVKEDFSPDRRSQEDRQGPNKFENDLVWDGPSWSDATRMKDTTLVPRWGEGKNEVTELAKEINTVRSVDGSWSHDVINDKQIWDPAINFGETKTMDEEQPPQWKTENGMENYSGDMEISPRDIPKPLCFGSPNPPTLPSLPFPAAPQNTASETSYEKHYPHAFHEQKVFSDSYPRPNPNFDDTPATYPSEVRNEIGNNDDPLVSASSAPMNVSPLQSMFQSDLHMNVQPISGITPAGPGQLPFPLHLSKGDAMQMQTSHNSSVDVKVTDGPHMININASSTPSAPSTKSNGVSNEQLAQLSHLTASLAQLLESRQIPQPNSGVAPSGISNFPNSSTSNPSVSGATFVPNQASDMLKQYDPISDSTEPKLHDLGSHPLPLAERKTSDKEPVAKTSNVIQKEPLAVLSKDGGNVDKVVGGSKAPEKRPFEDTGVDDCADDDCKKSKDSKKMRSFKFALADFVKELLKPTWKDGHVSKEAYKTIVKKVIDKVVETLGPQIPQTTEKIDQYLSYSKPKLDKLVQAYVGKYKKGKA